MFVANAITFEELTRAYIKHDMSETFGNWTNILILRVKIIYTP